MTDLTDSLYDVAAKLQEILTTAKTELGLEDVFYGDQSLIPKTPTACVEPGEKTRDLNGAPRRTAITFDNYILLYHNPVSSTSSQTQAEVDRLAEAVEAKIHADGTLGGIVIHSYVTAIESGYQNRGRTLFRASRLRVSATSQAQLPY